MVVYRESLADERFVPKELSYIAEALVEQGRNVRIIERSLGSQQSNGSYFCGQDYVLVEVRGRWPWQRADLMTSSLALNVFWYRLRDQAIFDLVERARKEFPNSVFSNYRPNDKSFLIWALQYL